MAATCLRGLALRHLLQPRSLRMVEGNCMHSFRNAKKVPKFYSKYLWIIGGGVAAFTYASFAKMKSVEAMKLKGMKSQEDKLIKKLTSRERRFIKFSSVEFKGQLYMTPRDFLDSVVEQEPRPRLKRRSLTQEDLNKMRDVTPPLKKGSKEMFRKLRHSGIISYTEYLFLLSVLTKPTSGFRIAFNMFDTDGNQRVEKDEFLVILRILGGTFKTHEVDEATRKIMERIFTGVWKDKRRKVTPAEEKKEEDSTESKENEENKQSKDNKGNQKSEGSKGASSERTVRRAQDDYIDDDEGLQRKHKVDTTLQIHFFGKKGNNDLHYEGFAKFMDNLQTEVLELEFSEFSKGNMAISEMDFAKILLRYTYLDTDEYDNYLERLLGRDEGHGITFNEFRDFCRFLNNLEDFSIAMRMYTLADRSISKDEFSRAVKICTGYTLSRHLIDTVFVIFDDNGDGLLSYKEFIAIMKDRLHRGFKSVAKSEGWDAFRSCVKQEMRMQKQ